MFHLESAISAWKRSLRHRKGMLEEDLDELEQHVRDQVQTLKARGMSEEEAYRSTLRKMGNHPSIEEAYRQVYWGKLRRKGMLTTTFISQIAMLKNYVTLALRNLKRYPVYTFINVAGLALGIGCCLLILLFVRDELSYDRFNKNADRMVRVVLHVPDLEREIEVTPTVVAPLFKRTFTEVEDATRIYDIGRFRKVTIRQGDEAWQESGFMYADSTVFNVFTFPFLEGSPGDALVRPQTLVLTESMADKYFGSATGIVGKTLMVGAESFEVTGVIKDIPSNAHFRFDILGSFSSTRWADVERWDSANFYTYLLLTNPQALAPLQEEVGSMLNEVRASMGLSDGFGLGFQRVTDIYLKVMGRERYVWLFSGLALLILFVACINYINLSTARSTRRAREVGMRKALGANRGQIIRQFFGESAILAAGALVLGIGLAALILPTFNNLSGKALSLEVFSDPRMWLVIAALMVVTTLGSGMYPSLLLSGFRPAQVLKGSKGSTGGNSTFRKALVIFQFSVTVFLFIATASVFDQLNYIMNTDVGFDRNQVVVLPIADAAASRAIPTLAQALNAQTGVVDVSAMNAIPGNQMGGYSLLTPNRDPAEDPPLIGATPVDHRVIQTLGLDLLTGPGFSTPSDYSVSPDSGSYQYVVNEALIKMAGWTNEDAIGRRMAASGNRWGEVVGVIRDYNFLSLHQEIQPLALFVEREWNVLLVKLAPGNPTAALEPIRATWNDVTGGSPFVYSFLDDEYASFYRSEQRLGLIFGATSILAILVAGLGLFGLASFTAEQRTREIGIRKVMGASVGRLVTMLNREFTILVLAAFVLAAPLAWWAMDRWLQGFAYRAGLSWITFLGAGFLALGIAWATVSYQSIRAATIDPVRALRHD